MDLSRNLAAEQEACIIAATHDKEIFDSLIHLRDGRRVDSRTKEKAMPARTRPITVAASVAVVFGLLTIVSGGRALFGEADMGAVVPFVLWFNFVAGFAYVLAGVGLWYRTGWSAGLSVLIALATAAVFVTFLWQVWTGTEYEARTMGAMILRLVVWAAISIVATRSRRAG